MLALLSVIGLNAQSNRFNPVGFGEGGQHTTITPGQEVALQASTKTEDFFLHVNDIEEVHMQRLIDDRSLFIFEDAGEGLFYLKNKATNKYVQEPKYSSGEILTESVLRAAKFRANNPHVFADQAAYDTAFKYKDDASYGFDINTATIDALTGMEALAWKFVLDSTPSKSFVWNAAAQAGYGENWRGTNTWMIYSVEPKTAHQVLAEILSEMAPLGENSLKIFVPGTDPAQVDPALVSALQDAYLHASTLVNEGTASDADYQAAQKAFIDAWNACKAAINPMREGYFYFSSWRTVNASGVAIPDNAVYENSNKETVWTYVSDWRRPATPSINEARYIYKITKGSDGYFYLQNYYTKRYLGYINGTNKRIPTTEAPEAKFEITIHPRQPGMFSVVSVDRMNSSDPKDRQNPAMHSAGDYEAIVYWTRESDPSAWYFNEVDPADIAVLDGQIEQVKLNEKLSALVTKAEASYKNGFAYKSDAATKDSKYENPGIATGLFTNAQEPSEGPIANATDGDFGTFFHTAWSADRPAEYPETVVYHNICADLGSAVNAVIVKITKRVNVSSQNDSYIQNAPSLVRVYATNDTTGFAAGDYSKWVDMGLVNISYPYKLAIADGADSLANRTGLAGVGFPEGQSYRYIRMDVIKRGNSGDLAASAWKARFFNLSEIRFYDAQYDAAAALNEAVPADVMKAFTDAMAIAKDALIDKAATQEIIDNLQTAYDNYLANYPDVAPLKAALTEAKAQGNAAVEGSDMGYFQAGAKQELLDAVAAIQATVKPVMTVAEINTAMEAIKAAMATFNSKLIKPVHGNYYWIKSVTNNTTNIGAANAFVYAAGNGSTQVRWGGANDSEHAARLNQIWRAEVNEDGSYKFFNMATGTYLGNPKKNNVAVKMTEAGVSDTINIQSAKAAGIFNIVIAPGVYLNAQPSQAANVVTWNAAGFNDNSAFVFEPAEWAGMFAIAKGASNYVTRAYPFGIKANASEGEFFKVLGTKEGATGYELVLAHYPDGEIIPAGTPYIFKAVNDATIQDIYLEIVDEMGGTISTLDALTYDLSSKTSNGLVSVLKDTKPGAGRGKIVDNKVLLTAESDLFLGNSAYLFDVQPTTEAGDAVIPMEALVTGINSAVIVNGVAPTATFDLQGRRVAKTQKGLYIINGQKVLVK